MSDVPRSQLLAKLTDIFANRAQRDLFVKSDDNVSFAYVAEVIDIGKAAECGSHRSYDAEHTVPGTWRVQFLYPGYGSLPPAASCKRFQVRPRGPSLKEKDKKMNGPARFWVLAVTLTGMVLSMSGCNQLEARDQLNKGVEAYKSAHYEEAIEHFQKATELDPNLPMAKTYLATALAQNVVPGLTTPDNLKTANQAIEHLQGCSRQEPERCQQHEADRRHLLQHQGTGQCRSLAEEGSRRRSQGSRGGLYHRRDRLDQGAREQAEGAADCRPE